MAKAVIIDTSKSRTSTAKSADYSVVSAIGESHTAKITDIVHDSKISNISSGSISLTDLQHSVSVSTILPFYVKFTTIGIEGGYGPSNPAPIGIAVIGTNNYIL